LGISAIGFTISKYEKVEKLSPVDSIELSLNEIQNAVNADQIRDRAIREIMNIAEKYNKNLPSSINYQIANEIYNMEMKFDNLNVDLICATITHESASTWNPKVVSYKGAIGLMQIMPRTGKFLALSENMNWTSSKEVLFDPVNNVRLGCLYLSSLIEIYGVEGGLAAYNGGEKKAATWLANNKATGILWRETQKYVPAVMRLYNKYKN
jgi:soluble lytic murein transglycosylase